jgi:hypothetical protein
MAVTPVEVEDVADAYTTHECSSGVVTHVHGSAMQPPHSAEFALKRLRSFGISPSLSHERTRQPDPGGTPVSYARPQGSNVFGLIGRRSTISSLLKPRVMLGECPL